MTADADGDWTATVDLRRGRNQFDVSAVDPDTGKRSESPVQLFITVPFLAIEAPTLTARPTRRGGDVRERRDPGPGHGHERDVGRASRPRTCGPAAPPGRGPRLAAAAADAGPGDRAGRGGRAFTAPFELTAGRWALTVTASEPEGKARRLTRNVTRRLQGRQRGRDDQGRPGLAQGLGRRQGRSTVTGAGRPVSTAPARS